MKIDNARRFTVVLSLLAGLSLLTGHIVLGVVLGACTWYMYKKNNS